MISHTAKDVEYNVVGYVLKNLDEVKITMIEAIQGSTNPTVKYIFMNVLGEEEYKVPYC
jgi:myosin heavy subunit